MCSLTKSQDNGLRVDLYLIVCDFEWMWLAVLCVTVCDCVWLCVNMYDCVCVCVCVIMCAGLDRVVIVCYCFYDDLYLICEEPNIIYVELH